MAGSDENNPGVIGPSHLQGGLRAGGGGKFVASTGQNRRALSTINQNVIGAPPYPCAVNKRPLSERNAVCDKIPTIPVHRPITRKFAVQMANKQQIKPEEIKKSVQSVPISNESEDCTIIDADDPKASSEFDVPMFVQHTEAMLEEIDRMEEVEMKDVDEEPFVDIDNCDKKNPLAVVEYIDDIYKFYRKAEYTGCVPPSYMAQQYDINERMRGILIDWLIEVHYKFELMDETLYLTVNLVDRFLAVQQVVRKKLQLVGITAMLLACKYEEVSVPVVEDLVLISDKAYSRKEVLDMEKLMINTLQFNLSLPTPYVFMRRFLKVTQSNKKLELLSFFTIELCLVEYEMLKFPPSLLAAVAILTASVKGSIKVCHLYFEIVESLGSAYYLNWAMKSIWRMDFEMIRGQSTGESASEQEYEILTDCFYADEEGLIVKAPACILDRWMRKQGNCAVTEVLVQWIMGFQKMLLGKNLVIFSKNFLILILEDKDLFKQGILMQYHFWKLAK